MSDVVEITGTLSTPYLPSPSPDLPWLCIEALDADGVVLGGAGAQVSGSPLPFRIHIDRSPLADDAPITFKARCRAAVGSSLIIADASIVLALAQATQAPVDLELETPEGFESPNRKRPVQMSLIELSGHVHIPPEVVQATNKFDVTLLAVQADGYVNQASSNLAEHSLHITGSEAAFSLFVDADSVPADRPLRLNLGLYNHEGTQIYAGKNFKNLDLSNPPDLSAITLKLPPR